MTALGDVALKVRSKNAGPFWITIDIFCGGPEAYMSVRDGLSTPAVAALFRQPVQLVRRFDMPDLAVVKFSFPRPVVQGAADDRDMHGAAFATILAEMELGAG